MIFAVVTQVGDPTRGENLATAFGLHERIEEPSARNGFAGRYKPAHVVALLMGLRIPVFTQGEILILDGPSGHELVGAQRRPAKWPGVEVEEFTTVEDAIERSLGLHEPEPDDGHDVGWNTLADELDEEAHS